MTSSTWILITIIITLSVIVGILVSDNHKAKIKIENLQIDAEKYEEKWYEYRDLYFEEKEERRKEIKKLKDTRLTPEQSEKIHRNMDELQTEYAKVVLRNEHLEGQLKNSDLLLDRYREYCGDVLILGLECKPSKTPICMPDFVKEENPDS